MFASQKLFGPWSGRGRRGHSLLGDVQTWGADVAFQMGVIGPGDSRDPALTREVLDTALAG